MQKQCYSSHRFQTYTTRCSFTPTQSGIESFPTVTAAVLKVIVDGARVTYLLTKPNPLHATRPRKQNEISLRLDNSKEI
jgi:hypothetical protein